MQKRADLLLAAVASGVEVPGGVFLFKALQQAQLDYSAASLSRIDALLQQIRSKLKPTQAGFLEDPARENFALTLAFYLGACVARQLDAPIEWHGFETAQESLPAGSVQPGSFAAHALGRVPGAWLMPMSVIEQGLFDEAPELTAKRWVKHSAEAAREAAESSTSLAWDAENLDCFMRGDSLRGGVAYETPLRSIKLDYSMESLIQLDELLRGVRAHQPDYAAFINQAGTANFSRLIATYVARTAAIQAESPLKWIDYQTALQYGLDVKPLFETMIIAIIGQIPFYPLHAVHELLFSDKPAQSCVLFAKKVLASKPAKIIRLTRCMVPAEKAKGGLLGAFRSAPKMQWQQQLIHTGFMAAHGAFMAQGGGGVPPTLFQPAPGGKGTFVDLSFLGDGQEISERAMSLMQENPEGLPYQIQLFEGYINLPLRRMDAIVVHLLCYERPQLSLQIGVPFTSGREGFCLHPPCLIESSADASLNAEIASAFFAGVDSNKAIQWQACEVAS